MLDKLKDHALSLYRSIHPQVERARTWADRDRINVVRHRVAYRLNQRRLLVVVATALAGLVFGSLTTVAATGSAGAPAPEALVAAEDIAMQQRQVAAERADRAARGGGPAPQVQPGHAATPEESPTPEPEPEPEPDWVHPMPGARTTSCFGPRWGTMHAGVDLAAPHGTPIYSVGAGTVTHAGWVFGGYGISVVIDHQDGHYTHYAHASAAKVSLGDRVEPGDLIALEGSTGDSTGPHLHFEVHKGRLWNQVEPTRWLSNRGVHIGGC